MYNPRKYPIFIPFTLLFQLAFLLLTVVVVVFLAVIVLTRDGLRGLARRVRNAR